MEESPPDGYNHGNRAFLQALQARGTMTFDESRSILAAIFSTGDAGDNVRPEQITEEDFLGYIDAASQALSLFDYEVRNTLHQVTKQRVYAIVNTTSDPQTQLATTYAADELSFIKRILDAMFDKYNTPRMEVVAITEMQAIKLARPSRRQSQPDGEEQVASTDKGLKHSEVESVLTSLVKGGWMEKSREGFYSLSPRALLELRPWLVETFNDPDVAADEWQRIKFCEGCKDLVTIGLRCPEPDCSLRLHDGCQDAFWRVRRGTKCPKCTREWTGKNYVGERAVTMTEAFQRGRRRSGGRKSTLADDVIRQEGVEDDADEGQEENEDEDDE